MRIKANNFHESVVPLTCLFAMIGQGFYYYPIGRLRPVFSIIYSIVLTASAITAAVMVVLMSYASSWFGKEEKIFYDVIYVNYGVLMLIQGFNWYHARTFQILRNRLSNVDETLKQLGVTFDYSRDMRLGFVIIGIWILVIICLDSIDLLWLLNVAPIGDNIMVVTVLHYPVHVNTVIAAIFYADVRLICSRFEKLNLLLESLTKPNQQPANIKKFLILRSKINPTSAFTMLSNRIRQTSQNYQKCKDTIKIIKHVHLELKMISKTMDRAYGGQLTLEVSAYFVIFTGLLFDLYEVFTNPYMVRRAARATVIIAWITAYFSQLLIINRICEKTSYQSHRTAEIIHRLSGELYGDEEFADEIRQFSMQLSLEQLEFSPGEFFVLGDRFVQGFLGSVTTYLIILVQMG